MNKSIRVSIASLAIAIVSGCASQSEMYPPYLASAFSHQHISAVSSISYQNEQGSPITEREFAAQYARTTLFQMTTKPGANGLPDVTVRVRSRNPVGPSLLEDVTARIPVSEAVADFRSCPPPRYPVEDLGAKHTGKVTLKFLVGVDGYVKQAEIARSSGYPGLDRAAMVSLGQCRFRPAMSEGRPIERWSPVQFEWSLK
jgi:TonB family protein